MTGSRTLGWGLFGGGILLVLIAVIWGRTGYYASQGPILLLLLAGGAALAFLGGRMLRKPRQDNAPVQWRDRDGNHDR